MTSDTQRSRIWFLLPVIATVACGLLAFNNWQVGSYHDDAWYIVTARELAAGNGFARPWTLPTMPETWLPPGYPLLLSPLVWLFPSSFVPLKLLNLAAAAGSVALCALYLRRRLGLGLAWFATLAVAANAWLAKFVGIVMADVPFLFMIMLILVLADHVEERSDRAGRRLYVAIGLVATLSYFVRSWGLALVAAIVLYYALRRRWFAVAATLVPFAVCAVLWLVRNTAAGAEGLTYGISPTSLPGFMQRTLSNPLAIALEQWGATLPLSLVPQLTSAILPRTVASITGWLIVAVIVIGYIGQVRRRWSLAEVFALAYAPIITIAPITNRYWLPLLPLLVYYLVLGMRSLLARVPRLPERWGTRLAAVVLLGLACLGPLRVAGDLRDPPWRHVPDVAIAPAWIVQHSPPDALILANTPRVTYLYSEGRKVLSFPDHGDEIFETYPNLRSQTLEDRFLEVVDTFPVSYVLLEPIFTYQSSFSWPTYVEDIVLPVVEREKERFRLVFSTADRMIRVYQVQR